MDDPNAHPGRNLKRSLGPSAQDPSTAATEHTHRTASGKRSSSALPALFFGSTSPPPATSALVFSPRPLPPLPPTIATHARPCQQTVRKRQLHALNPHRSRPRSVVLRASLARRRPGQRRRGGPCSTIFPFDASRQRQTVGRPPTQRVRLGIRRRGRWVGCVGRRGPDGGRPFEGRQS